MVNFIVHTVGAGCCARVTQNVRYIVNVIIHEYEELDYWLVIFALSNNALHYNVAYIVDGVCTRRFNIVEIEPISAEKKARTRCARSISCAARSPLHRFRSAPNKP